MDLSLISEDKNWWVFTLPAILETQNLFCNKLILLSIFLAISIFTLITWAFPLVSQPGQKPKWAGSKFPDSEAYPFWDLYSAWAGAWHTEHSLPRLRLELPPNSWLSASAQHEPWWPRTSKLPARSWSHPILPTVRSSSRLSSSCLAEPSALPQMDITGRQ